MTFYSGSMALEIKIQNSEAKGLQASFFGPIDEDAGEALDKLAAKAENSCSFNLEGVTALNSLGVRNWIHFIRSIDNKYPVSLTHLPPFMVSQINMIPSFIGHATIESVFANVVCSNGHESLRLFEKDKSLPKTPDGEIEEFACSTCGALTELEELEEEFFAWLGR